MPVVSNVFDRLLDRRRIGLQDVTKVIGATESHRVVLAKIGSERFGDCVVDARVSHKKSVKDRLDRRL